MSVYYICLGSNFDKEKNLSHARKYLAELFPAIVFGKETETEAVNVVRKELFLNQVARFQTDSDLETVRKEVKRLEVLSGRTPEKTVSEIIPLDIDILICDDVVLKPEDMKRTYVIEGMKTLSLTKQ